MGVTGHVENGGTFPRMDAEYQYTLADPPTVLDGCAGDGSEIGLGIDYGNGTVTNMRWGEFPPDHDYKLEFYGLTGRLRFVFQDCGHADNSGSLTLRIYACR
jgi:hypothetical protein